MLNIAYGFEGTFKPLGQFPFVSRALTAADPGVPSRSVNRFHDSWFGKAPVPVPENYLLGIDQTKAEFEIGKRSYLRGQWKFGGWWYYYLYGLAVKVPLGTWGLLLLAAGVRVAGMSPRSKVQNPKSEDKAEGRRQKAEMSATSCALPFATDREQRTTDNGQYRRSKIQNPKSATWRDEGVLLAPVAAVLLFVSSQTGFNAHLRYVLPAFPFVFIWVSKLGTFLSVWPFILAVVRRGATVFAPQCRLSLRERAFFCGAKDDMGVDRSPRFMMIGLATVVMLGWSIVSSLSVYPHCLAYFNALGGGPLGGHAHLIDSNIDWGQDLLYLRKWLVEHPEARPLGLAYFGLTDPGLAGIDFRLPPRLSEARWRVAEGTESGPRPGWYAISVNYLRGYHIPAFEGTGGQRQIGGGDFTYFLRLEPVAVAGRSIYIYHVTPKDAARFRGLYGGPSSL